MENVTHIRAARVGSGPLWLVFALAGALVAGCDRDAAEVTTPTTEAVAENTARYTGQKLTLTGEVDEVFGDRAFELEGNDVIFDSSLLVLTRSPVRLSGRAPQDDDRVVVTGTVRNFVVADLERELNWDLTPELEVDWRNKPALVAESISSISESARWSEQQAEQDGVLVGLVSMYYVPDPKALVGQKIELEGVPVQQTMGDGVWLGANHTDQVFAVPSESGQLPKLSAGDSVDLKGTVREMPSAEQAIERWSLSSDLAPQIQEEVVYIEASSVKKGDKPKGTAQADKEAK